MAQIPEYNMAVFDGERNEVSPADLMLSAIQKDPFVVARAELHLYGNAPIYVTQLL